MIDFDFATHGFFRAGAATPECRVADVDFNCDKIEELMARSVSDYDCRFIVFPELAITGYSCGDLFFEDHLVQSAVRGLQRLAVATSHHGVTIVVGLPVNTDGRLFNCAALLADGEIQGVVPKTFLPNTAEFYEERWFSSATDRLSSMLKLNGEDVPFGEDLIFAVDGYERLKIGIEIC